MKTAQAICDYRQQICRAVLAPGFNCTRREKFGVKRIANLENIEQYNKYMLDAPLGMDERDINDEAG